MPSKVAEGGQFVHSFFSIHFLFKIEIVKHYDLYQENPFDCEDSSNRLRLIIHINCRLLNILLQQKGQGRLKNRI